MSKIDNGDEWERANDEAEFFPEDEVKKTPAELKLERELQKAKEEYDLSQKYLTPEHKADLMELIRLKEQEKSIKEQISQVRERVRISMIDAKCFRAVLYGLGINAMISQGGKKQYSNGYFDESRFKSDNPELYKKYWVSGGFSGYSNFGTLTVKSMTDHQMELFEEPAKTEVLSGRKPTDQGVLYSFTEFRKICKELGEGYAKYYDEQLKIPVELVDLSKPKTEYKWVIWYGK